MKIEMGESLVCSWLKYEKRCQIVQMNWKASEEWNTFVDDKNLNALYKDAKKFVKQEEDFNFVSKHVKTNQLIRQGEVDVIGVEFDTEVVGRIKRIHAVDVAFHEAGLNYGNEEETKARIIKKYIRTALSIYRYFGVKSADIYFVTPNTRDKYRNTYAEAKNSVNELFVKNGFEYSFYFYSNEDFYSAIFVPVQRIAQAMTDTSELFARSLKLMHLMDEESKKEINVTTSKEEISSNPYLEEKKIGIIVRESFDHLSQKQLLSDEMIHNLQSAEYSRNTFNLSYPLLIQKEEQRFDEKGRARYYTPPYYFNGGKYFLCNDWYDSRHKDNFIKWYSDIVK
jgi:hypothetical protein